MKHKKFELKTRETTIASYNEHTTVIFNFVMIWAMNPAKKIVKIILNGWILPKVKAAFMLIENVWG